VLHGGRASFRGDQSGGSKRVRWEIRKAAVPKQKRARGSLRPGFTDDVEARSGQKLKGSATGRSRCVHFIKASRRLRPVHCHKPVKAGLTFPETVDGCHRSYTHIRTPAGAAGRATREHITWKHVDLNLRGKPRQAGLAQKSTQFRANAADRPSF